MGPDPLRAEGPSEILRRITRFELAAGGPHLPSMLDLEKSSQILDG
jgi:hypothetical protein